MNAKDAVSNRKTYLDWLRVLSIVVVFFFHSARAFNFEEWHIRDVMTSGVFQFITDFLGLWMMPIIFVVSGASIFLSMKDGLLRTAGKFLKDKFLRLIVPLFLADFTHVALQVYIERSTHGDFSGSFFQFYPHYFEGWYGFGGNFGWIGLHLWYLVILFVLSVILLPVFLALKSKWGSRILDKVDNVLAFPGVIYVVSLLVVQVWINTRSISELLSDDINWGLGIYATFLLAGFVILSSEKLQESIRKQRWISLVLAIAGTIWFFTSGGEHKDMAVWPWMFAILGFAMQYLKASNPGLKYANEAVLPFYILHQSVIVVVDYFLVQTSLPLWVKYPLVLVISFPIIMGIYEFLVRRNNVMRFLFGMKPLAKPIQASAQ